MKFIDFLFKKPNKRIVIKNNLEFEYVKINGAKSVKIIVKSPYKIKITMPYSCSFKTASDFLNEKMDWVEKNIKNPSFKLIDENYKTKTNNFIIKKANVLNPIIKKRKNTVEFIYPCDKSIYDRQIQTKALLALKKALHIQAEDYLAQRLNYFCEKFGFKYNKLSFKTAKTRWGSCSSRNNINLNIFLTELSNEYIDYVLLHELCHTKEKNHGKNFWALLEKYIPNAKAIQKQIKIIKIPL